MAGPNVSNRQVRLVSAMLSLTLALSLCTVALADSGDDSLTPESPSAAGAPAPGQKPTHKLFLQLTSPADLDVAIPLDTDTLTVQGVSL